MKRSEKNKDKIDDYIVDEDEEEEIIKDKIKEIEDKKAEEEELNEEEERKRTIKKIIIIVISVIVLIILTFLSLRYLGNFGIVVNEKVITSNKINDDLNGLKIVHFSDILYDEEFDRKQIERLIGRINHTNPDIVIFTGDLIKKEYKLSFEEKEYLIKELGSIKSNISKLAITGEEDKEDAREIISNSGFEILEENKQSLVYIKNSYIAITRYDDIPEYIGFDNEIFNIILTHNPDNIDSILSMSNPDVIFAGHSLNGQLRVPLIGGLLKYSRYTEPYYEIDNTKVYISGGIGNRDANLRSFNNPNINFYRIIKEITNK
jgi:predicted MPP superfamily phosphohydrolase